MRRGGTTWRARRDAGGHRIAVQGDTGSARVWVRAGATVLAELRGADGAAPSGWDVWLAPGGRAAAVGRQPHTGARRLFHRDALGSVRVETSGATVVAGRDYDPWGVELAGRTLGAAAAGGGPGFTGHLRDPASGLDVTWARALSPGLGRWTAPDPLKADFPGWSPYNYVENDPLGKADPTGLCPIPPTNCVDVGLFVWDVADFVRQPSAQTATGVLLGVAALVPGIPNINPSLRAGRTAGRVGRIAEDAVAAALRIPRNAGAGRVTIPGSGRGGFRVPDFDPNLTIAARGTVVEVKDVRGVLSITPQLRDLAAYAATRNVPLEIFTNASAPRRGELFDLIDAGLVILTPIPFP